MFISKKVNKKDRSVSNFSLLRHLFSFVYPYRKKIIFSLLIGLCIACLAPIRPYLIRYAVDEYIKKDILNMLFYITLLQIGIVLIEAGLQYSFSYTSSWIGQHVIKGIRKAVFEKIIHLQVHQFDQTPVGVFSTRTIDDAERINDIFANGLLPVLIDLISVFCILGYMFYINAGLALVALSPFPLLLLATWLFKNSVKKSFNKVRTAVATLNAYTNEQLSGIKTIKTFVVETHSFQRFNHHNEEHRTQNIKSIFAYSIFFPVVEIISALSIGVLVWWAVGNKGSPGTIIAFVLCINNIFRPLRIIADKFNTIQMGLLAASRIFEVLNNNDILLDNKNAKSLIINGAIIFDKVSFSYKPEMLILKEVSFSIKKGETLAIVGRTGSGKTSIIALLNRMYQHQRGNILIDGNKIEDFTLSSLRSQIGYVSQDVFLFAGTVYENIAFANNQLSLEEVISICKKLNIYHIIERLPLQYNFMIVDGGTNLSTGQRQLISIARVFAMRATIVVFDEATSSIDPKMEEVVDTACQHLFAGKTAIIIAHRYKTILRANKIIVLENGSIIESGSHNDLLQKQGYYQKLYQNQFHKQKAIT